MLDLLIKGKLLRPFLTAGALLLSLQGCGNYSLERVYSESDASVEVSSYETKDASKPCSGKPYYPDKDGDKFGDMFSPSENFCQKQPGYVENNLDCDDSNPNIHPEAEEICNGIDDNCNGITDEGVEIDTKCFKDKDNDTFGDPKDFIYSCSCPDGFTKKGGDCDDLNFKINHLIFQQNRFC